MNPISALCRLALAAALLISISTGRVHADPAPAPSPTPPPSASPTPPPLKPLWEYRRELGLNDQQVYHLQAAAASFEAIYVDAKKRLEELNRTLADQVSVEAPLDAIKHTLEEIAAIQIQVNLADVRTARIINHLLRPDQLEKWRAIQKAGGSPK